MASYYESKELSTRVEAISKLFTDHICKTGYEYVSHKWRMERYWNEECDNIFKANMSLMSHLFNLRGGKKRLPGEKLFMSIDEFLGIMVDSLWWAGWAKRHSKC